MLVRGGNGAPPRTNDVGAAIALERNNTVDTGTEQSGGIERIAGIPRTPYIPAGVGRSLRRLVFVFLVPADARGNGNGFGRSIRALPSAGNGTTPVTSATKRAWSEARSGEPVESTELAEESTWGSGTAANREPSPASLRIFFRRSGRCSAALPSFGIADAADPPSNDPSDCSEECLGNFAMMSRNAGKTRAPSVLTRFLRNTAQPLSPTHRQEHGREYG